MKILTLENDIIETDLLGDEVDDLNFWILDYSNEENTDYFTKPLLFLESFSDLKLDIKIGDHIISIPREWSILCADQETGDAEMLQPKMPGFNEREFSAFLFNPQSGFKPQFAPLEVINLMPEIRWTVPKLRFGQILISPLYNNAKSPCIFLTHQKNNKIPDVIKLEYLF